MTPFGRAYNPEGLSKSEIDYLVTFMRYTWDERFEAPPIKPLFPALADGEAPSYAVHIQHIVKRYCISCHREGKTNNNYLMASYEEILTTGDNKDFNVLAGDPEGYLLQIIQGTPIPDPEDPATEMIRVMPPTSPLKPNVVDVFVRWIMAGPQTADRAALPSRPHPERPRLPHQLRDGHRFVRAARAPRAAFLLSRGLEYASVATQTRSHAADSYIMPRLGETG
jgi:hypothetical protein